MKKKSASQSAPARRSLGEGGFFNLRVLIGLSVVLAGVFLALLGFGAFSAQAQQNSTITQSINPQLLPPGFDCSSIDALGIDKQENHRAGLIMIACGRSKGGAPSAFPAFSRVTQDLLPGPLAYGGTDVNLITGADVFAHVTQSETYTLANPDNPNQIVVTYNDSRTASSCYGGGSFSTDGGTTFTRLTPSPFCAGHGTNFGDPVTLYNKPTSTFFGIFLATGCGGQGIGAWKSTDGGATWSVGACIHNGFADDRESGWADNNPASPFFGRMYVSWNDFARGANLFVRYSTDNGLTWTQERQLSTTFFRNVQITGDLVTGDVYVAAMNDSAGGIGNRANKIYRSTDGGNTWTNTYTGPNFLAAGRFNCGFACMYNNYWRVPEWGQPAAYNGVVSLNYAARNPSTGDPGDVFYIRSTDMGVTFSAPFQLNANVETTKAQWQPNLSVSDTGTLFATWYDETPRTSSSCQPSSPTNLCYQMHSRKSTDNGITWLADETLSDVASPLPLQPDGTVQATYVGDYNYGSATATKHVTSWVDGRVPINNQSQQDSFFDSEPAGGGGGEIQLDGRARRQGNRTGVSLRWSPADGGDMDVLRDGNVVQTTPDDGRAVDNLGGATGTFTYQVCETDSGDCSNEVVVQVTSP